MAERKVDKLAGKGSLADKLKRRRMLLEAGDTEGASKVFAEDLKIKKKKK